MAKKETERQVAKKAAMKQLRAAIEKIHREYIQLAVSGNLSVLNRSELRAVLVAEESGCVKHLNDFDYTVEKLRKRYSLRR
jgi:hypothetical protein